jgi:hypothetical protein
MTTVIAENNPVPTITSISPSSAAAGSTQLTLTVDGTNFVPTSEVYWNGVTRPTTFVSTVKLTASIPASDLAQAGTGAVSVFNPTPGGGQSSALTFTVTSLTNLLPVLTGINPTSKVRGQESFTLTLSGSNFSSTSKVLWNGDELTTSFVDSTSLTAVVPASLLAVAGTANVSVFTPTPGGGTSTIVQFTIQQTPQYESDVSPRVYGDQAVTVADWTQIGRFVVKLDTPANGDEFQRIDGFPYSTLGDGVINVSDWVQAGRYMFGLDPLKLAGGPKSPLTSYYDSGKRSDLIGKNGETGREIRVRDVRLSSGGTGIVPVDFESLGNENAMSFTLTFDPGRAKFSSVALADHLVSDATLIINRTHEASGKVAITIALPTGRTFRTGAANLLMARFNPTGDVEQSIMTVSIDDSLVGRDIVNVFAEPLSSTVYRSGVVTIEGKSSGVASAGAKTFDHVANERDFRQK